MSDEITPEWIRVKREVEALWRGAWDTIHRLEDRLHRVERRVDRLENPKKIDKPPGHND